MASHKHGTGPDRLGGAIPPSSGGYGDPDKGPQQVGESDAPDVKQQEQRPLEGLSGMNPAAGVRPDNQDNRSDADIEFARMHPEERELPPLEPPPGVIPDEIEPD